MNEEKAQSIIESAFENPKDKLQRGAIVIPSEPLDMDIVIQAAIETDEEQDELDCNGPDAILEETYWPNKRIFSFCWQSMGPMIWECHLNALYLAKDTALVWCYQDGDESRQGIALVRHSSKPRVMSTFFKALIKENGAALGLGLFGSLPSNTHNKVEELIPEEVVRAAYWEWLKWADDYSDVDWHGMVEEILARGEDPIGYPRKLIETCFAGFEGDAEEWQENRKSQNGRLTIRAKCAIFHAYFKQSYGPY